mmetsp:Transcript_14580/g.25649  ORF Transcript_14580/g.25649 Transcript_14580/m.25649 type:complete len:228 (+) Transcript_14580:1055-1738(+)
MKGLFGNSVASDLATYEIDWETLEQVNLTTKVRRRLRRTNLGDSIVKSRGGVLRTTTASTDHTIDPTHHTHLVFVGEQGQQLTVLEDSRTIRDYTITCGARLIQLPSFFGGVVDDESEDEEDEADEEEYEKEDEKEDVNDSESDDQVDNQTKQDDKPKLQQSEDKLAAFPVENVATTRKSGSVALEVNTGPSDVERTIEPTLVSESASNEADHESALDRYLTQLSSD